MDLKTLLGDAYKEGISHEEIDAALADRDLIEKSEAETLATNRAAATKRLLDQANKKLAEAQKKGADAGNENAALLERINALEERDKENTRQANIATHKASLIGLGYDEVLATETATAMVDNDVAKIIVNQGKFQAAREQAMKEELMKNTGNPAGGGSDTGGVDYAAAKAKAAQEGNDLEYLRLCREEAEQTSEK